MKARGRSIRRRGIERYLQLCAERNMCGVQPDHAGQLLPCAAPAVEAQLPQAAGDLHAEIAAAAQAGGVAAGGDERGQRFPHRHPGDRRDRAAGAGAARRDLQRQGLLRPAGGAARARHQRRRDPAAGAALSVPEKTLRAGAGAVSATPMWCGARKSRRTWAPGTSSIGGWRRCWPGWMAQAKRPVYVGREAAASPATGLARMHSAQQAALVSARRSLVRR